MPKFTALQTMVDKLNLVTREILTGIPVIRAFSREKHEEERFEDAKYHSDEDKPLCKPLYDIYDAGDDADHERSFRTDHLQRFLCSRQRKHCQVGDVMAFIQYAMPDHHVIFDDHSNVYHAAESKCICTPYQRGA